MSKTAIMVDGGFFHKRANALWGSDETAKARAERLHGYCFRHLRNGKSYNELYRIFYYDCPPMEGGIFHPMLQRTISMKNTDIYKWMTEFLAEMTKKRKVAMRLGRIAESQAHYALTNKATKDLYNGNLRFEDIKEEHFAANISQKGVDMKLGIDIVSVALKQQVSQIVLISGDSDFVPAAKIARREGIDFVLDPMWAHINPELQEHIDGLRSVTSPPIHKVSSASRP